MNAATLRAYKAVHTWVGLGTGLLLFIAFYAGALTVFHDALERWEQPTATVSSPVDPQRAQALVDAVLRAHPEAAADFRLDLGNDMGEAPSLSWRGTPVNGGAPQREQVELAADGTLRSVSPADGLADAVYQLHYTAGLPTPWGTYLFGVACLLYGVALVSGVVIHAPVLLRDLFALRPGKNLKRFWQDGHNLLGLMSLPFHVIYAWSGAVLALGTLLLVPFQVLVFDGKLLGMVGAEVGLAAAPAPAHRAAALLPVPAALAVARDHIADLVPTRLHVQHAGDAHAVITVEGHAAQRRMSDHAAITMDGTDGTPLRIVDPTHATTGQTLLYGLDALHFADYGGTPLRWLYFLLGLLGALVFFSGNLLWIESRRRQRGPQQRTVCMRMAQCTLGVSLGSILGVAAMALATRLAPAVGWTPALWPVYWGTFAATLAFAFSGEPSRVAGRLLWFATALHVAVPVVDGVCAGAAWRDHAVVDLVSLCIAAVLAWMARRVQRRARFGDPNSVWAAA